VWCALNIPVTAMLWLASQREARVVLTAELHGARGELRGTPKIAGCALSRGRYITRTTLVLAPRAASPGRSRSSWTPPTSPARLPESGVDPDERSLLLIWFSATSGAVAPHRAASGSGLLR
jgi:hypothetical protein